VQAIVYPSVTLHILGIAIPAVLIFAVSCFLAVFGLAEQRGLFLIAQVVSGLAYVALVSAIATTIAAIALDRTSVFVSRDRICETTYPWGPSEQFDLLSAVSVTNIDCRVQLFPVGRLWRLVPWGRMNALRLQVWRLPDRYYECEPQSEFWLGFSSGRAQLVKFLLQRVSSTRALEIGDLPTKQPAGGMRN
jgi:hypothetical protein